MSKLAVIFFCGALALLAGCTTTPTGPPPNWSATNDVQQVEVPKPFQPIPAKPIPPVAQTNLSPVVKLNLPPLVKTNLPAIKGTNVISVRATNIVAKSRPAPVIYTWTSLARWAVNEKMHPPLLLSKSPLVTYSVSSGRGVMILAIGSREATWNGITVRLGYAPEIIDGEVFMHGLDLQKILEPFLLEPPMTFGTNGTNRVIVIDPGHGGMNAGTISILERRPEKEFTLDLARRLQPLLEQEGWKVFLTRTNDTDVSLSNRVAVAESRHADAFVSLHFNSAAPDQKPMGLATFCLTPVGMPSNETRGYPDALFQGYPNNNYDSENVQLAERLQRSLLRTTSLEDRGVSHARFMGVLRGQRRPAVLVEAGFLSNPHEARRIADPAFRQKLAEALAAALK